MTALIKMVPLSERATIFMNMRWGLCSQFSHANY